MAATPVPALGILFSAEPRAISRADPPRTPRLRRDASESVEERTVGNHALDRLGDDAQTLLLEQQTELFTIDKVDSHRPFPNRLPLRILRESVMKSPLSARPARAPRKSRMLPGPTVPA